MTPDDASARSASPCPTPGTQEQVSRVTSFDGGADVGDNGCGDAFAMQEQEQLASYLMSLASHMAVVDSYDREQLAAQLRAAAPDNYED
jgi:mono/diheme cytochrome c family protein